MGTDCNAESPIFRWRENATEGRVYRKVVVGTIEQFPTKTAAKRAVDTFRSTINAVNPAVPVTLRQLVKHYEENELPGKAFQHNEPSRRR